MNKQIGVVVSASMMIVATQAMAHVAKESERVIDIDVGASIDPQLKARISSALAKRDVRDAMAEVFPLIMKSFGENGVSVGERYQVAQYQDHASDALQMGNPNGASTRTDNANGVWCYTNCHSNCHSACHGSRGWR